MEDDQTKVKWTESDRAFAFLLHKITFLNPEIKISQNDFKTIALSRKIQRTHGSWSLKLANYRQAERFLSGLTKTPLKTGNAEKHEFPRLSNLFKNNPYEFQQLALSECINNSHDLDLLIGKLNLKKMAQIKNQSVVEKLKLSISAKPFTILAGGTGTGKTRSAKLVAAAIAGKENVEVVAVGADWTDNRPLLGFRNLFTEGGKTYVAPPALRMILKAISNPLKPFFLILDEMNLSHVERYFADFLSSMESKEPIKLHDSAEELKTEDGISIKGKIEWPTNLFVIGTVNIDETTYMFSPKVLDRAHVIEFKVSWDEITNGLQGAVSSELTALTSEQVDEFVRISCLPEKNISDEDYKILLEILRDLHEVLQGTRFAFAHRTARECLNFIASAQALAKADIVPTQDIKGLIDLTILQKALPKLNGAAGTLTKILEELLKIAEKHGLSLCKQKLEAMSHQLKADQFVSFIQ